MKPFETVKIVKTQMLSAFAGNENWFTLDQPGEQVVVGEKTDSSEKLQL